MLFVPKFPKNLSVYLSVRPSVTKTIKLETNFNLNVNVNKKDPLLPLFCSCSLSSSRRSWMSRSSAWTDWEMSWGSKCRALSPGCNSAHMPTRTPTVRPFRRTSPGSARTGPVCKKLAAASKALCRKTTLFYSSRWGLTFRIGMRLKVVVLFFHLNNFFKQKAFLYNQYQYNFLSLTLRKYTNIGHAVHVHVCHTVSKHNYLV